MVFFIFQRIVNSKYFQTLQKATRFHEKFDGSSLVLTFYIFSSLEPEANNMNIYFLG
jgi:hypothetical protein